MIIKKFKVYRGKIFKIYSNVYVDYDTDFYNIDNETDDDILKEIWDMYPNKINHSRNKVDNGSSVY